MYKLKFWFEHGGGCIWTADDAAREVFGYKVRFDALPVSDELKSALSGLEEEYRTYLNWSNPTCCSPWTDEHKNDFISRADDVYVKLKNELGDRFYVINDVRSCVL